MQYGSSKLNDEDEDEVKVTCIRLSCALAVVTSSAVRGNIRSPAAAAAVVDVRCSLYPKTHPLVWL